MDGEMRVLSVDLQADGTLVAVYRVPSNSMYACNPPRPVPDRIFREVFAAKNGRIEMVARQEGRHAPARKIPEAFEFD